jgi:hypothetical protein
MENVMVVSSDNKGTYPEISKRDWRERERQLLTCLSMLNGIKSVRKKPNSDTKIEIIIDGKYKPAFRTKVEKMIHKALYFAGYVVIEQINLLDFINSVEIINNNSDTRMKKSYFYVKDSEEKQYKITLEATI